MSALWVVLGLVVVQRLAELAWSARNTRALLARGGREAGAGHYPLLVLLHASWLAAMALTVPPATPVNWTWLGLFLVLQVARLWVMASLGPYWTTRIITVDGAPLVRRGPYRFMRHPNYAVVAGEMAALPMAFGAWRLALAFSLLNGLVLWLRVRTENAALAGRRLTAAG